MGAYLLVPAGSGGPWLDSAEFHARHLCGVVALGISGPTGAFTQIVAKPANEKGSGERLSKVVETDLRLEKPF